MQPLIRRRGLLKSAGATCSFLSCYGMIDRGKAAMPARITPQVVDKQTIQAVVDTNHDIFISGDQFAGVGVERVRSPAAFNGRKRLGSADTESRPPGSSGWPGQSQPMTIAGS